MLEDVAFFPLEPDFLFANVFSVLMANELSYLVDIVNICLHLNVWPICREL